MSAGTKTMATKKVNILDQAKTGSVFQGNVTLYNVILPRSLYLFSLSQLTEITVKNSWQ